MRLQRAVRASAVAGLSALGAVVAHMGPAALTHAGWLAVALAGGGLAVAAIAAALAVTLRLDRRAAGIRAGDPAVATPLERAVDAPPPAALAGAMMLCQGAAHVALLLAGVQPVTGPLLGPLLHLVLAAAAAALLWRVGRALERAAVRLADALSWALEVLLQAGPPAWTPCAPAGPSARPGGGAVRGRAPPSTA
jgi:hypothetical protein